MKIRISLNLVRKNLSMQFWKHSHLKKINLLEVIIKIMKMKFAKSELHFHMNKLFKINKLNNKAILTRRI